MPAVRLSRRRKSSHILFTPAKAGIYGISPRPVTFAPNVTPVSYVDPEDPNAELDGDDAGSPTATLFPPSANPPPPPTRKRCPPGKRRSQGYIPRPPNAFMLFRADFVRQKHVPGSIETNHGSLSKIIGNCWRQLPLDEKRIWEVRAKQEKANHKALFPDYRFRPVHNKNKNRDNAQASEEQKRKEKPATTLEDERRCEEVAQLLLEGKKGEELAQAVRNLDRERERELNELEMQNTDLDTSSVNPATLHLSSNALHMPMAMTAMGLHMHMPAPQMAGVNGAMYLRRPSSVPLPSEFYGNYSGGGIAMPSLPFFNQSQSRPVSPVASISRQGQNFMGAYASQGFNNFPSNLFQSNTEFTYGSHDEFAQQHQHQQQTVDPTFAFSNPFAPNQTLPLALQPTPTASSFSPGFASGFGHPSFAQRNSFGLGRRASSAQAMLMRNYTMPMYHEAPQQPLERDHSPLPDVEPELFAPDFSFGGSPSGAPAPVAEGPVSPVHTPEEVNLVSSAVSSGSGSSSHPSTVYDGSPSPTMGQGLDIDPTNTAFMHHHTHHQHHAHQTMEGMYSAEEMYGVNVADGMYEPHMPLQGLQEPVQMWASAAGVGEAMGLTGMDMGKGMEMEMGMESYFEAGTF